MKKNYTLFMLVGICVIIFIILTSNKSLSSDIILNKLPENVTALELNYSDISTQKIRSYNLIDNKLKFANKKLISFTEGFIPKDIYKFYMDILKTFATSQNLTLPNHLHDFYEDDNLVIMSFSGQLKDIYIIEKSNLRVYPLNYNPSLDLGPMYVSHIKIVDNLLIILAGEANSYNALIYEIYLPTFEVIDATRLNTHTSAIEDRHYTITENGDCVFINGNNLKIYDVFSDTYKLIPLDFTATYVTSYKDSIIVLGESNKLFKYAIVDANYKVITSNKLKLPASPCEIVKILAYDDYLYIVSYDPNYRRYANYISIHHMNTGELLYTLGIKANMPYALLDANLSPQ